MNYFYLFPDYEQAKRAFKNMVDDQVLGTFSVKYSEQTIITGKDRHRFIVVPITVTIQDEKIMALSGKCDATALYERLDSHRKYIEFRVNEIEHRLNYEPKGDDKE